MPATLPPAGPPLRLPKFTFLFGEPPATWNLATAIAERDPQMLLRDFEEPLREATLSLFFGGPSLDHDLTDPEQRNKPLPISAILAPLTVDDWLGDLQELLRNKISQGALGYIAVAQYMEDNTEAFFERTLYRDASEPHDLRPFVNKFGPDACISIHLGNLGIVEKVGRHIWLPVPETAKQMELLERELNQLAARGAA